MYSCTYPSMMQGLPFIRVKTGCKRVTQKSRGGQRLRVKNMPTAAHENNLKAIDKQENSVARLLAN
jgi:hypothetical protein